MASTTKNKLPTSTRNKPAASKLISCIDPVNNIFNTGNFLFGIFMIITILVLPRQVMNPVGY